MNAWLARKAAAWTGSRSLALLAWASAGTMFCLLLIEHALRVLHPASILFLLLATLTLLTPVVAMALEIRLWLSGDRSRRSAGWTAMALGPAGLCAAWGGYAYQCNRGRDVPRNLPMQLIVVAAASVAEAREVYLSPHRIETERLVMFYDDRVAEPRRDAEAMDRHVADMERLTGLRLRTRIFYVRGPMFADRHMSFLGLAFGSSQGPPGYVDLHELAHATIGQGGTYDSDPPTLLSEGWAESQSNTPRELADRARATRHYVSEWARRWPDMSAADRAELRQRHPDPGHFVCLVELAAAHGGAVPSWIDELTDPRWYHHDGGAVYPIGGALTDHLIRRYGAGRFVQLYFAVRPESFGRECVRILGADVKAIESDFWQEQEQLASPPRRPSRP